MKKHFVNLLRKLTNLLQKYVQFDLKKSKFTPKSVIALKLAPLITTLSHRRCVVSMLFCRISSIMQ